MVYIMSIQHSNHDAVERSMSASEGIYVTCTAKVVHNLFDELKWEKQSSHSAVEKIIIGKSYGRSCG